MNEVIEVDNVPEFDNFYLDMNGIIHHCSHGNTGGRKQASEDHMWLDVFKYVSGLVYRIKPRKLLYLAVDGVAPRAKMNQQRSRRFRAAHDAKETREKNSKMDRANGAERNSGTSFDSNCITPGTEFMERLVYHLEFFVQKKIAEDPLWKDLKVVLSGPDVPGEGEHKIMDFIRSVKSQPDFDPNTRHCLYGLDADLIMLSLASHEPYFALLREEIDFSFTRTKLKENRSMVKPDKFQLLHIGVLREYLALDFLGDEYLSNGSAVTDKSVGKLLDRIIDDFILFCFLVGNDFLPHLPFSEIGEGGLNKLFYCYKELMRIRKDDGQDHFLVQPEGTIDYANLYIFLDKYMATEYDLVETMLSNVNWKIGQTRICNSETPAISHPSSELYHNSEDDNIARSQDLWEQVKKIDRKQARRVSKGTPPSVEAAMEEYYDIKLGIVGKSAQEEKNKLVLAYLEGLQWVLYYYYKGPPSWDWYYPYHYSPFAVDVVSVLETLYKKGADLKLNFQQGKPFMPFQQLMAVLPPASGRTLLPQCLYQLMVSAQSPIRSFYPEEFQIDIDGVRVPWGGVTIIPFVDERLLVSTIDSVIAKGGLTEAEKHRNSQGTAKVFFRVSKTSPVEPGAKLVESVVSTIPTLVKNVDACRLAMEPFIHKPLPETVSIFPHHVLDDYSPLVHKDFPSLFKFSDKFFISFTYGSGVRIFNSTSKQESLLINLTVKQSRIAELERVATWTGSARVSVNFPFYSQELTLVSLCDGKVKVRFVKGRSSSEVCERAKFEGDIDWLLARMEETGLLIDIEESLLYSQPVVELSGDLRRPETVKALASIAMLVESRPKKTALVTARETDSTKEEASENISLNIHNERIFGRSFTMDSNQKAVFAHVYTAESLEAISSGITEVIKISKSVKYSQWLPSSAIAQTLGVSDDFVWAIFGEVWIRFGKFQEEVGMNLWSLASTGEPQCVPGFSMFTPSESRRTDKRGNLYWNRWDQPDRREWKFSAEAVNALRGYMQDQPELIKEIQESVWNSSKSVINGGLTVQGKKLFSRYRRPAGVSFASSRDDWVNEYHLNKLVGYVNSSKWKNMSICPWNYESLGGSFVAVITDFLDQLRQHLPVESLEVPEANVYPLCDNALFSAKKNGPEITIGQRGVYVKSNGLVPAGTRGTVIGFYGTDMVDILLDDESMNASSLGGACPDMRGIRIKRSDWRAPNRPSHPAKISAQLSQEKNKILAKLLIEHEKSWGSRQVVKQVVSGAIQPVVRGAIQSAVPPGGLKLDVKDLFAVSAKPSAEAPRKLTEPRRPLPPTALVNLPVELGVAKPVEAPKVPDFLLSKLRPAPPK